MHAFHSCIIVTETSVNKPVEPAETVKPEPGVEFVIEPEENISKQLGMFLDPLNLFNLVISLWYTWLCYMFIYCIVDPTLVHLPCFFLYIHVLATCS
jgi:hypothetical protein